MSLPEAHKLSIKLSDHLDNLGYNTVRVAKRVQDWKKMSDAKTMAAQTILEQDKIERLHVGSHGEGIALAYESDTDILQVNHSVLCVDNVIPLKYDDKIIFHLEQEAAPAGYAFLRLSDKGNNKADYMSDLEHALIGKEMLLSSKKYICKNEDIFSRGTGYIAKNTVYHSVTGPAIPKTLHDGIKEIRQFVYDQDLNEDIDFVQSFTCLCPDLLQSWSVRPRPQDWPSKEMVEQVKSLQCYVVPVGKKGSDQQHLQWRISFTPAEMHLVQALNDTQRKVLIILRLIAKHRLKLICPDITSYIVKNVIFWVSEEFSLHQFQSHLLLDRVTDALKFLKTCILKRSLQTYMIPERDLLQGKISLSEETELIQEISNMIYGCGTLYSQIEELTSKFPYKLTFLSYIDALTAEVEDLFTTGRLAEFIIRSDKCSNHLQYTMCYHRFITLPFIWKHRGGIARGIINTACKLLLVALLPPVRYAASYRIPVGAYRLIGAKKYQVPSCSINTSYLFAPMGRYIYYGLSLLGIICLYPPPLCGFPSACFHVRYRWTLLHGCMSAIL